MLALIGLVVSLFFLALDPFNLSRSMAYAGEKFAHHVTAAARPADPAAQRILVVLADDSYLRPSLPGSAPRSWPLRWPVWGEAIEAAAETGARAVFLDVVLTDERPKDEVEELVASLKRASERTTIFLAVAPSGSQAARSIHPALLQLSQHNPRIRLVRITAENEAGPYAPYGTVSEDGGRIESTAVAMAKRLCGDFQSPLCRGTPPPALMELRWNLPPAQNCGYDTAREEVEAGCAGTGGGHRLWRFAGLMMAGTFNGLFRTESGDHEGPLSIAPLAFNNYPLPYTRLQHLLGGLPDSDLAVAKNGLVLIGTNFASAEDLAATPLYGEIPGVFLHGAAIDNLLAPAEPWTFGPPDPFGSLVAPAWKETAYIALWMLLATILIVAARLAARWSSGSEHLPDAAEAVAVLVAVLLNIWAEVSLFDRGPSSWFIVLGVLTLASLTARVLYDISGKQGAKDAGA